MNNINISYINMKQPTIKQIRLVKYKEVSGIKKNMGLMFKSRKTMPLLFRFDHDVDYSIHSIFVFFPFEIIWYDSNNKEIESRIVEPFRTNIKCSKPYRFFIEIPLSYYHDDNNRKRVSEDSKTLS